MPNNFKAISLKKSKSSEITKSGHENKSKSEEVSGIRNIREVPKKERVEENTPRQPSQPSMTVLPSKDVDECAFALGKKMKEMADNSRQKFSNLKRQEEENRISREDYINKKIDAIRQKMENKMKLEEERKKAKLEHMQKVAEQRLREIAMRELAEREAICKKEILAAIEKVAISKGSWFEVAKILYKAGILQ